VFVPHWADGDVIVGSTLLDCKTVITVRNQDRIARWLYQLLGYAWLDSPADRYGIRSVGLYLARHGVLLTWPLDYFEQTLLQTGPTQLSVELLKQSRGDLADGHVAQRRLDVVPRVGLVTLPGVLLDLMDP
jgi:hypothetical protein